MTRLLVIVKAIGLVLVRHRFAKRHRFEKRHRFVIVMLSLTSLWFQMDIVSLEYSRLLQC